MLILTIGAIHASSVQARIIVEKKISANISYLYIWVWWSLTESPNLNTPILAIWDPTAKFNSHQYFRLYTSKSINMFAVHLWYLALLLDAYGRHYPKTALFRHWHFWPILPMQYHSNVVLSLQYTHGWGYFCSPNIGVWKSIHPATDRLL